MSSDMKRSIYLVFLLLLPMFVFAQELDVFNEQRLNINKTGMLVLGSWAATNIALSPVLASREEGWKRSFHQMNGYWNGVNLVIAGLGYLNALNGDSAGLGFSESLKEQHSIEKILLFNAGLDLGYIAGGLYLNERAKNSAKNQDRFKGFGRSIMLQGGFLFVFDVILYLAQQNHAGELYRLIDQISFSPGHFQLILRI